MLVNGKPSDLISIRDRGLLYGDGIFETILCENGEPPLLDYHLQRFSHGCQRLNLVTQNKNVIAEEIRALADGESCVIKLILTRGVRDRGYAYDACDLTYTRIIDKNPLPDSNVEYALNGINLTLCQHQIPHNKKLAGIKHLNRLDQIIGRSECPAGYQEAAMMDSNGYLVEGTMSNIFMLADGIWHTPGLEHCGINGVMREFIIRHANDLDIITNVEDIMPEDMQNADALFVCNSIIGIWPVARYNEKKYLVHADVKRIQQYLHNHVSGLYSI